MAKKGFEIDVAMNAREFQRGVKDVEGALEDVADALDDVARDAARSGDTIGDEFSDGSKDAERSVERLERTFKQVADGSKRETRSIGDAMQKDMKTGSDGAGEAVREFGDEARSNMAETFSSFRGEAEDFVGIVQDTFGGVISNLGPLGMAFGAAGALGIGLFMAEQERAKEEAQEFRAEVGELIATLIEIGDDPVEALAAIADRLKDLATESEEGKVNLAELRDAAETSVTGYRRLADAYAGNVDELEKMVEAERERLDAAERAYNADKRWDSATTERLKKARDGQQLIVEGLEDVLERTEAAEAGEAAWLDSNGPLYEARAEQLEAIQGELNKTIDSWGDYVDAETGAIDPAAYIAGMAERREAIANFNSNVQTMAEEFSLSYDETQAILDKGLDFAPHLQSIIDSGMGEAYVEEIRKSLDGGQAILDATPTTLTAEVDARLAEAELERLTEMEREADVIAVASVNAAQGVLSRFVDTTRTARIGTDVDISTAERALNDFIARRRTATVTVELRDQEGQLVP